MTTWTWSAAELGRLAAALGEAGVPVGPLSSRLVGDGHSNLTFLIDDGVSRFIARRPPVPPTPPGAHDVLREARFLAGLHAAGLPVPHVVAAEPAGRVLDVPVVVMQYVPGPVVTTRTPSPLDRPQERRRVGDSMVDTLARLHAVDPRAVGLDDVGRPEGFNTRHLTRMARLLGGTPDDVPAPFGDLLARLLETSPPEAGAGLVHNDFRIGNLLLSPDRPGRVAAVLDWELATLGDPLWDLAYLVSSWPVAGEEPTPTQRMGLALLEEGYPTRQEVIARYAARTGRDVSALAWYLTAVHWKLAVLYEYQRRRSELPGGDPYYADPRSVAAFLAAAERHSALVSGRSR